MIKIFKILTMNLYLIKLYYTFFFIMKQKYYNLERVN